MIIHMDVGPFEVDQAQDDGDELTALVMKLMQRPELPF